MAADHNAIVSKGNRLRMQNKDKERLLSGQDIYKVMKKVGYTRVDTHCISGVTFKTLESQVGKIFLPIYNIVEWFMGVLPLSKKYGSFLICYGEK